MASGSTKALAILAGGGVVVAGIVAGVLTQVPVSSRVPDETYVAGVAVGGFNESQLQTALAGSVSTAVEKPVTFTVKNAPSGESDTFEVQPDDAGISLDVAATANDVLPDGKTTLWDRFRGGSGRTDVQPVMKLDDAKAKALLEKKVEPYHRDAKSGSVTAPVPTVELDIKTTASFTAHPASGINVSDGTDGVDVSADDALAALKDAVTKIATTATVTAKVTPPKVTTDDLKKIDQVIGTFTTYHACCAARNTNIKRIAQIVDNSLVLPGAQFSLNEKVGRRTTADGFVPAGAIAEGEIVDQVGGGVSQFSTTLYNASWFSGVDVIKHQPHSKYITRYPEGREATLDYDSIQNIIKNDTDAPILIRTMTTDTSVTVTFYGHTGDRRVNAITGPRTNPRPDGGFTVATHRDVYDGGKLRTNGDDRFVWTYTGLD